MPVSPQEIKMRFCSVLVTSPVEKTYDYRIPDGVAVEAGSYVLVPLGARAVHGVVWALSDQTDVPENRIKDVLSVYDLPPMGAVMRSFIDWVAQYNLAPRGAVLKMALSVASALEPAQPLTGYVIAKDSGGLSPAHQAVVDALKDGLPRRLSELQKDSGAGASAIKTLVKHGVLAAIDIFAKAPCASPKPDHIVRALTPDQRAASNDLIAQVGAGAFRATLLDGVTGSGKTEVYFEAIAEAIRRGQQVLILMPEIALSNAFIGRFAERFGCSPALWHSSMTPAQRRMTWRAVVTGQTRVVVGARSALFLPFAALGLIIVDEEHDAAYKQEEVVIYHARDMAVVRASLEKIPVVLTSATPALETLQNVMDGRYGHLVLPDRFGGASKPEIKVLDLRKDKPERGSFLSPVLKDVMVDTLERHEQVLLFLNRRGYAPLTLCRTCGHRIECPKCTAWLVEHKRTHQLHCHHCGYAMKTPNACPSCHDADSLVACGPGVERIADEIKLQFPEARTMVMASDVLDTHDKMAKALAAIRAGEVDVIIGTQVIAKGHHFPQITCVGIIDADLGLSGGDLRATERSFQLLHQVAGRAGREQLKGRVYLQTFNPEQRVMQLLAEDNRDGFLAAEAEERRRAFMPPFSRLAALVISGSKEAETRDAALMIGRAAPRFEGVRVLGPAQAQMYRIRGKYRQRILVQADKRVNIQKLISEWLGGIKVPSSVRVTVDIDPQNFL